MEDRLAVGAAMCGDKPCITGARVYGALLGMIAGGYSVQGYPQRTRDDFAAVLEYGSRRGCLR